MILNSGLDNAALHHIGFVSGRGYGSNYMNRICLGTGSEEPAVTQTELQTETHRTNSYGGFPIVQTWEADATNDVLRMVYQQTFVFNFAASWTLREFGSTPYVSAAGGPLNTRALFDTPLNVEDGYQLQFTLTLTIETPWLVTSVTFPMANVGNVSGQGGLHAFVAEANIRESITGTFWPRGNSNSADLLGQAGAAGHGHLHAVSASNPSPARNQSPATVSVTFGGAGTNGTWVDVYVTGTYTRKKNYRFTTAQANIAHTAWLIGNSSSSANGADSTTTGNGYKLVLDTPFTKESTHELILTLTVTWTRG